MASVGGDSGVTKAADVVDLDNVKSHPTGEVLPDRTSPATPLLMEEDLNVSWSSIELTVQGEEGGDVMPTEVMAVVAELDEGDRCASRGMVSSEDPMMPVASADDSNAGYGLGHVSTFPSAPASTIEDIVVEPAEANTQLFEQISPLKPSVSIAPFETATKDFMKSPEEGAEHKVDDTAPVLYDPDSPRDIELSGADDTGLEGDVELDDYTTKKRKKEVCGGRKKRSDARGDRKDKGPEALLESNKNLELCLEQLEIPSRALLSQNVVNFVLLKKLQPNLVKRYSRPANCVKLWRRNLKAQQPQKQEQPTTNKKSSQQSQKKGRKKASTTPQIAPSCDSSSLSDSDSDLEMMRKRLSKPVVMSSRITTNSLTQQKAEASQLSRSKIKPSERSSRKTKSSRSRSPSNNSKNSSLSPPRRNSNTRTSRSRSRSRSSSYSKSSRSHQKSSLRRNPSPDRSGSSSSRSSSRLRKVRSKGALKCFYQVGGSENEKEKKRNPLFSPVVAELKSHTADDDVESDVVAKVREKVKRGEKNDVKPAEVIADSDAGCDPGDKEDGVAEVEKEVQSGRIRIAKEERDSNASRDSDDRPKADPTGQKETKDVQETKEELPQVSDDPVQDPKAESENETNEDTVAQEFPSDLKKRTERDTVDQKSVVLKKAVSTKPTEGSDTEKTVVDDSPKLDLSLLSASREMMLLYDLLRCELGESSELTTSCSIIEFEKQVDAAVASLTLPPEQKATFVSAEAKTPPVPSQQDLDLLKAHGLSEEKYAGCHMVLKDVKNKAKYKQAWKVAIGRYQDPSAVLASAKRRKEKMLRGLKLVKDATLTKEKEKTKKKPIVNSLDEDFTVNKKNKTKHLERKDGDLKLNFTIPKKDKSDAMNKKETVNRKKKQSPVPKSNSSNAKKGPIHTDKYNLSYGQKRGNVTSAGAVPFKRFRSDCGSPVKDSFNVMDLVRRREDEKPRKTFGDARARDQQQALLERARRTNLGSATEAITPETESSPEDKEIESLLRRKVRDSTGKVIAAFTSWKEKVRDSEVVHFKCWICNVEVMGKTNLMGHIGGNRHQKNCRTFGVSPSTQQQRPSESTGPPPRDPLVHQPDDRADGKIPERASDCFRSGSSGPPMKKKSPELQSSFAYGPSSPPVDDDFGEGRGFGSFSSPGIRLNLPLPVPSLPNPVPCIRKEGCIDGRGDGLGCDMELSSHSGVSHAPPHSRKETQPLQSAEEAPPRNFGGLTPRSSIDVPYVDPVLEEKILQDPSFRPSGNCPSVLQSLPAPVPSSFSLPKPVPSSSPLEMSGPPRPVPPPSPKSSKLTAFAAESSRSPAPLGMADHVPDELGDLHKHRDSPKDFDIDTSMSFLDRPAKKLLKVQLKPMKDPKPPPETPAQDEGAAEILKSDFNTFLDQIIDTLAKAKSKSAVQPPLPLHKPSPPPPSGDPGVQPPLPPLPPPPPPQEQVVHQIVSEIDQDLSQEEKVIKAKEKLQGYFDRHQSLASALCQPPPPPPPDKNSDVDDLGSSCNHLESTLNPPPCPLPEDASTSSHAPDGMSPDDGDISEKVISDFVSEWCGESSPLSRESGARSTSEAVDNSSQPNFASALAKLRAKKAQKKASSSSHSVEDKEDTRDRSRDLDPDRRSDRRDEDEHRDNHYERDFDAEKRKFERELDPDRKSYHRDNFYDDSSDFPRGNFSGFTDQRPRPQMSFNPFSEEGPSQDSCGLPTGPFSSHQHSDALREGGDGGPPYGQDRDGGNFYPYPRQGPLPPRLKYPRFGNNWKS